MRNEIGHILAEYDTGNVSGIEATDQILSLLERALPEERLGDTLDPALLHYVDEERWANGYNACLQEIKERIK